MPPASPPQCGSAATQHQLFVAMWGIETRAAGSSAFSRGRITPDCYVNCPDFGKTLRAKQNTSVGCVEPYGLPVCDLWLTAASPARPEAENTDGARFTQQLPAAPGSGSGGMWEAPSK